MLTVSITSNFLFPAHTPPLNFKTTYLTAYRISTWKLQKHLKLSIWKPKELGPHLVPASTQLQKPGVIFEIFLFCTHNLSIEAY